MHPDQDHRERGWLIKLFANVRLNEVSNDRCNNLNLNPFRSHVGRHFFPLLSNSQPGFFRTTGKAPFVRCQSWGRSHF